MSDRFRLEKPENQTGEAKVLSDRILAVSSAGLGGPFNMMVKSPKTGNLLIDVLDHLNGSDVLVDPACRRMVQLMVARAGDADYPWWAHAAKAVEFGQLTQKQVDAINRRETPSGLSQKMQLTFDYGSELLVKSTTSDETLERLKTVMDEAEIVDLIVLCGIYRIVASLTNERGDSMPSGVVSTLLP